MSSTREKILQTLLSQPRCSINDLAEAVGINPISVRHHIVKLQADGYVTSEEERHGVGRPRGLYFLTEAGMERFPTRYLRLTNRLLEQLKDTLPQGRITLNNLFSQVGSTLASQFLESTETDDLSLEDRLNHLQSFLKEEGFHVEWERRGDEYYIRELNCPYFHVGQSHPEVCAFDQSLISRALEVPAEKVNCILNGDTHCTYVVSPSPTS